MHLASLSSKPVSLLGKFPACEAARTRSGKQRKAGRQRAESSHFRRRHPRQYRFSFPYRDTDRPPRDAHADDAVGVEGSKTDRF